MATDLLPSLSLHSKSAIVTGATRGIGRELALILAARGANVAIVYTSDSSKSSADELVKLIEAIGRRACSIQTDLQDKDCGVSIVQEALRGLSVRSIEILVNNAALFTPPTHSGSLVDSKLFQR